MMGFDDAGGRREPNQRVTQLMLAALNSAWFIKHIFITNYSKNTL
jgi:hypothetical protein